MDLDKIAFPVQSDNKDCSPGDPGQSEKKSCVVVMLVDDNWLTSHNPTCDAGAGRRGRCPTGAP